MNPELMRNLWLEISLQRFVVLVLILGLVYGLCWGWAERVESAREAVTFWSYWLILLLTVFWGSRQAADAVLGEIMAGTWPAQRMTSLGPATMALGKLFGSTAFVWAATGLIVLASFILGDWSVARWQVLAQALMLGALTQGVALMVSLALMRNQQRMRLEVVVAQLAALAVAFPLVWPVDLWREAPLIWYGIDVTVDVVILGMMALALAFVLVGIVRQMRQQLQFRSLPLAWPGFLFAVALVLLGFDNPLLEPRDVPFWHALRYGLTLLALASATAVTAFVQPMTLETLARLSRHWRAGDRFNLLADLPPWLAGAVLPLAITLALVPLGPTLAAAHVAAFSHQGWNSPTPRIDIFAVALLAFLIRDVAVLHLFALGGRGRGAQILTLVWLAIAYGLLPALLFLLVQQDLTVWSWCMPNPFADSWVHGGLVPAAQALVALGLLVVHARRLAGRSAPGGRDGEAPGGRDGEAPLPGL